MQLTCAIDHILQDRLMPAMHTIEISNGHDGRAKSAESLNEWKIAWL